MMGKIGNLLRDVMVAALGTATYDAVKTSLSDLAPMGESKTISMPPNLTVAAATGTLADRVGTDIFQRYFKRAHDLPYSRIYYWSVVAHDSKGNQDSDATASVMELHARMSDSEWDEYSLRWRDPKEYGDRNVSAKLRTMGIAPETIPTPEERAKTVFDKAMENLKDAK